MENTYFSYLPKELYDMITLNLDMNDIINILGKDFYKNDMDLLKKILNRDYDKNPLRLDLLSKASIDLNKYEDFLKNFIRYFKSVYVMTRIIGGNYKITLKSNISSQFLKEIGVDVTNNFPCNFSLFINGSYDILSLRWRNVTMGQFYSTLIDITQFYNLLFYYLPGTIF